MKKGFKKINSLLLIGVIVILSLVTIYAKSTDNDDLKYGFKKEQTKRLNDYDANGIMYTHIKTGATLFFIQNSDKEKSFGIGFKTLPFDNSGVNHIIEHSLISGGSKNYPVKNPIVYMLKQSLKTYINATTYQEFTAYPIASKNEKDFENLMRVYLDSVFFPKVIQNDNIFKQEGIRYEIDPKTGEITVNGTVFSEMKGMYSDPERALFFDTRKALFPDTDLKFDSGGKPEDIINITYKELQDVYKKNYKPSNSLIFLYGDVNIDKFLKIIDEDYLSKLDTEKTKVIIPKQPSFLNKVKKTTVYSSNGNGNNGKTYLMLSYVASDITNLDETMGLNFLQTLFDTDSSPIKRALIDSGIAENISFSYDTRISQTVFSILAQNIKQDNVDRFDKIFR